jgi:hypothetical protein
VGDGEREALARSHIEEKLLAGERLPEDLNMKNAPKLLYWHLKPSSFKFKFAHEYTNKAKTEKEAWVVKEWNVSTTKHDAPPDGILATWNSHSWVTALPSNSSPQSKVRQSLKTTLRSSQSSKRRKFDRLGASPDALRKQLRILVQEKDGLREKLTCTRSKQAMASRARRKVSQKKLERSTHF